MGDVDQLSGPFPDGFAEKPDDTVLGDYGVGEGAGHGDDAAFLQLGDDSGHGTVDGRGPEEGQGPTTIGHDCA